MVSFIPSQGGQSRITGVLSQERITGTNALRLAVKFAAYDNGGAFTVIVDADSVCPDFAKAEVSQVHERGLDEITRRLAPVRAAWSTLKSSLYGSGVFFKDPVRGTGVRLKQELTATQKAFYRNLHSMIDEVDTLVTIL